MIVSMPYFGLFSFLQNLFFRSRPRKMCQCPTSGFSHFYTPSFPMTTKSFPMCQCPTSGFSHFYPPQIRSTRTIGLIVSMPYFGLFSFLHGEKTNEETDYGMCQCPTSGFSHFYGMRQHQRHEDRPVSMPYFGLFSFLRQNRADKSEYPDLCQCPTSGFSHFYQLRQTIRKCSNYLCQCPTSGFSHFYKTRNLIIRSRELVSMPYFGLFSFLLQSTSRKPVHA